MTARKILERHEEVKEKLWGGKFWTSGYYANTVGDYRNKDVIQRYIRNHGQEYEQFYREHVALFESTLNK